MTAGVRKRANDKSPTVALVTGGNKGIGFAVAHELGKRGINVWLGARSEQLGTAAAARLRTEGFDAEYISLDVTLESSIHEAAARIGQICGKVDILINNAGIMVEMKEGTLDAVGPSQLPLSRLRSLFDVNFFGAVAVTQAFLPLVLGSEAGRIVNVSARFGSFAHQTDESWPPREMRLLAYAASKAALNMATVLFANELSQTRVKVNAVTPGTIATDLSGLKAEQLTGRAGYETSDRGAAVIVKYALLPKDGPTGGFFGPAGPLPW